MPRFRKRPVEVEAVQWTGIRPALDAMHALAVDSGCTLKVQHNSPAEWPVVSIVTLEGEMVVSPDDYVIKGVQGEIYPCKPDIFVDTYEPVDG